MDINLLVINAGNSRLAIGAFLTGELVEVTRVQNDAEEAWNDAISKAWAKLPPDSAVVGANVNLPLAENIERAVAKATNRSVQWIGRSIELPIEVKTEHPSKTGVDRVLNIAAAYEQLEKACVVVDAGTAITVDCCNDAGDFIGGAIAPGVALMLDALHRQTAALPNIHFDRPEGLFGRNTEQAIRSGIFHGIRGMVRELVEQYATELGVWPEIIATGGDAAVLFEGWELIHAVSPNLTLYGIALAYTEHHLKNEM